jgi:hypothetical protein
MLTIQKTLEHFKIHIEILKIPVVKNIVNFQPMQLNEMEKVFFSEIVFLKEVFVDI